MTKDEQPGDGLTINTRWLKGKVSNRMVRWLCATMVLSLVLLLAVIVQMTALVDLLRK